MWCWRRFLRAPWIARRSTQSILKETGPNYSLEGLMLKLKEAPILSSADAKSGPIRKDPDAGKDPGQEEKGATEGEMDGWCHWLNGHEFEQTPGDGKGQKTWQCCSAWGRKVRHDSATEQQPLPISCVFPSPLNPSKPHPAQSYLPISSECCRFPFVSFLLRAIPFLKP